MEKDHLKDKGVGSLASFCGCGDEPSGSGAMEIVS
jgi:hypothetical protein